MPRPFLKWAGGKGRLLPELTRAIAEAGGFERYHEPFVGGGALFFELYRRGGLGASPAFLSDNNPNLIDAYQGVKTSVEKVIDLLSAHAERHSDEYYYRIRATMPDSLAARAARIIYLNRTCFNGLYRENSKGEFNVPVGRYKNPTICDAENLRAVSEALQCAEVEQRHFKTVLDTAVQGDLVYFDPPYQPLSKTSSFTSYGKNGFDEKAQRRLAEAFAELDRNGVRVLLSNSMTPFVQELYTDFRIDTVMAARSVNSRADRRGKIPEALVRNF